MAFAHAEQYQLCPRSIANGVAGRMELPCNLYIFVPFGPPLAAIRIVTFMVFRVSVSTQTYLRVNVAFEGGAVPDFSTDARTAYEVDARRMAPTSGRFVWVKVAMDVRSPTWIGLQRACVVHSPLLGCGHGAWGSRAVASCM